MNKPIKCNIPGFNISIQPELYERRGGIYKIIFRKGRFYVGSTSNLRARIMSHLSVIRRDFDSSGLRCMKGYKGPIKFVLVEYEDDLKTRLRKESVIFRRTRGARINTYAPLGF